MPIHPTNWSAGSGDPTRNIGDIIKTGETPAAQIPQTLADALAAMGMSDYSYMFNSIPRWSVWRFAWFNTRLEKGADGYAR